MHRLQQTLLVLPRRQPDRTGVPPRHPGLADRNDHLQAIVVDKFVHKNVKKGA
jgi:hypothetical protein